MNRAAIYTRTMEGTEPDAATLQRYCADQGWEVVKQYHDRTLLGARDKRRQQDNLLRDSKGGLFDVVVVLSLSVWGKSLSHIVDSISALKKQGISLVSLQDKIDPETVDAMRIFMKAQKTEKIKAGMLIARLRGQQIGRTPTPTGQVASIISCFEEGKHSIREISRLKGIPRSTIHKIVAQHKSNLQGDQTVK